MRPLRFVVEVRQNIPRFSRSLRGVTKLSVVDDTRSWDHHQQPQPRRHLDIIQKIQSLWNPKNEVHCLYFAFSCGFCLCFQRSCTWEIVFLIMSPLVLFFERTLSPHVVFLSLARIFESVCSFFWYYTEAIVSCQDFFECLGRQGLPHCSFHSFGRLCQTRWGSWQCLGGWCRRCPLWRHGQPLCAQLDHWSHGLQGPSWPRCHRPHWCPLDGFAW